MIFIFEIYSFEAVARICVSGLLFDPEIPISTLFANPFVYNPSIATAAMPASASYSTSTTYPIASSSVPSSTSIHSSSALAGGAGGVSRQNSTTSTQSGGVKRSWTLKKRWEVFNENMMRPFALNTSSSAPTIAATTHASGLKSPGGGNGVEKAGKRPGPRPLSTIPSSSRTLGATRYPSDPGGSGGSGGGKALYPPQPFFDSEKAVHHTSSTLNDPGDNSGSNSNSNSNNIISLPFKLSINTVHEKTRRNIPYLRHSWSRIDFVAIASFWVNFALANTGLERGGENGLRISVFRAMSVIRTARLLTITSGTTVSCPTRLERRNGRLLLNVPFYYYYYL